MVCIISPVVKDVTSALPSVTSGVQNLQNLGSVIDPWHSIFHFDDTGRYDNLVSKRSGYSWGVGSGEWEVDSGE